MISLHDIGKPETLSKMYNQVHIPHGVYEEVCIDGDINKNTLQAFPNYTIQRITNENAKKYFKTALYKGEVEVMILADELNADICIIEQLAIKKGMGNKTKNTGNRHKHRVLRRYDFTHNHQP
jgi:predicted nucleic acid-binding protein